MARYYFHLRNRVERLLDPEGREIADPGAIASIVLREARELMAADVLKGVVDLDARLEVEDADGNVVHSLRFTDAVQIVGPFD